MIKISHAVWQLNKRLQILKDLGIIFSYDENHIDVKTPLPSDLLEVVKFICDPTYEPRFWQIRGELMKVVNDLHHEFWCWKSKSIHFNPEEELIRAIKEFLLNLSCKEQDEWMLYTSEETKEKIIESFDSIFNFNIPNDGSPAKYIVKQFVFNLLHDDKLSWTYIHSKLFQ